MDSAIDWLSCRQYTFNKTRLDNVYFTDRLIENFSCSIDDEYDIEGEMGMSLPPFVARFSSSLLHGNMLAVADEDGHVKLVDTSKTKNSSVLKEWSAHSNAVFDLAWVDGESKIVTASGDQTARLWDINRVETIGNFRGHTCSLKSVAAQPGSSCIFLTGSRDGNIMLWDTRCTMKNGFYTPVNTIHNAHELPINSSPTPIRKRNKKAIRGTRSISVDAKQSVTAVIFQDNCRIISSGACDGALKYWDLRKNFSTLKNPSSFHTINLSSKGPRKHGFTSLVLNSSRSRLYSVCTNNIIYEFSTTNLSSRPIGIYQGHRSSSFYVKAILSPDDRYLLCGSCDNAAYIWRADHSIRQPWTLNGHLEEVTSVAWSPNDGEKIVTCSDDNTFKVWRLFQDTSEPSKSVGCCVRKPTNVTEMLQEDVLISDLFGCKEKQISNTLGMCSNGRAKVRWSSVEVSDGKDTISEMSTNSKKSSFTNITPKISSNNTPVEKQTSAPLHLTSIKLLRSHRTKTPTPKSSRLFMETWLKSPRCTPAQLTPVKESHVYLVSSGTSDVDDKDTPPSTPSHQTFKGFAAQQERIRKTNLSISPLQIEDRQKKVSPPKRQFVNSQQYGNIKSMFTAMKRKCISPEEGNGLDDKCCKVDKENIFKNIAAGIDSKGEHTDSHILAEINSNDIKDILDIAEESNL